MLKNEQLKQWARIVSKHMPHLTIPQAMGLAIWSFGMVMTKSSSLTQVSHFIASINDEKPNTVRQRLKEWYQEGQAKKGNRRSTLDVTKCFAPLFHWVLSLLPESIDRIALAMDASSIGNKFTVLSINIVLAGCGIPLAWKIVNATEPGSWKPYWQELIDRLKDVVPPDYTVILAADRGLYADWLYTMIVSAAWHPFLRINHQGTYSLPDQNQWHPLADIVPQPGQSWSGQVVCFKTNPLACTLLARWDFGYKDPWLILTDLPPEQTDASWYGLRPSTECVYRDLKSDGWQWQNNRLLDPKRAERLWLAIAVSTLWMVILGGTAINQTPTTNRELLPAKHIARAKPVNSHPIRQLSCFLLGFLTLTANLLQGLSITLLRWTTFPSTPVDSFYYPNSS